MFIAIFLVLTTVSFVTWCILQRRKYSSLACIPGPKPLPVLGNALEFSRGPVEKMDALCQLQATYGPIIKFWIGPKNMYVLISDPKMMEFVLSSTKHISKSVDYGTLTYWLGQGLLLATGNYWHKKRKILTPTFHFKILEQFLPVFDSIGNIFVEELAKTVGKGEFDVYPFVATYTLDIVCETAMGTSVDAQRVHSPYVQAVMDMRNIIIRRVFSPWKNVNTLFEFSEDYRLQTKALDILHGFTRSVIDKRKALKVQEDNKGKEQGLADIGIKTKSVFLDLLFECKIDGRDLTAEEIREEVDTFMFEGHDTTASAISFAIFELANNPNIQAKAVKELESIFGDDKKRSMTYQDLQDMKYLDVVLKEVLRLYPSVPMWARQLTEDAVYDGVVFPAGVNLVLFTYFMQRREDLFQDALTFNPDRFFVENSNKQSSFAYVPFSAGPRNCIGQKFAMLEMKSALAKILLNYELTADKSHYPAKRLSGEVILKNEDGIFISVKKRH